MKANANAFPAPDENRKMITDGWDRTRIDGIECQLQTNTVYKMHSVLGLSPISWYMFTFLGEAVPKSLSLCKHWSMLSQYKPLPLRLWTSLQGGWWGNIIFPSIWLALNANHGGRLLKPKQEDMQKRSGWMWNRTWTSETTRMYGKALWEAGQLQICAINLYMHLDFGWVCLKWLYQEKLSLPSVINGEIIRPLLINDLKLLPWKLQGGLGFYI